MLAFGILLCAGLLVGHYFSGFSRQLASNRDVRIALLNANEPVVFLYRSFSRTVTAVRLPRSRFKNNGSNYQKACAALAPFFAGAQVRREDVFYFEVDARVEELGGFYEILNSWRSRPVLFFKAARGLWRLKNEERTNLSFQELLLTGLELSRLNSSNFIVADFERETGQALSEPGPPPEDPGSSGGSGASAPPSAIRVEVLNASGRKDLALQATKYLRKRGFDVINFGTYMGAGTVTKIVNCSGGVDAAKAVREALGLAALEIYSKPEAGGVVEVSVILGKDFNGSVLKN